MMSGTARRISPRAVLVGVATLLYPLLVYAGLQYLSARTMALGLVALILLRAGLLRGTPMVGTLAIGGAVLAGAVAISGAALPLKLYPALVNATLLAVFGWSLWRGPPVVERLARLTEPDLPPSGIIYTRRVTQAWCLFFVFNGTVALTTALWASDRVWALYNGFIAYGLIGTMFAGEWLVRRRVRARSGDA